MIPVISLLGMPAATDLLRTSGLAFVLAAIAFGVLILAIIVPVISLIGKMPQSLGKDWDRWIIPILVIGGLAVAGYLTFVEATGSSIECGVMSGCTSVQESSYSKLFGILPVAWLGLSGYIAILASWILWQFGPDKTRILSVLAIWGMCVFGVLLSAYLTYLEPFVIGATCMWCITSAIFMIQLLWASIPAAQQAMAIADDD